MTKSRELVKEIGIPWSPVTTKRNVYQDSRHGYPHPHQCYHFYWHHIEFDIDENWDPQIQRRQPHHRNLEEVEVDIYYIAFHHSHHMSRTLKQKTVLLFVAVDHMENTVRVLIHYN